MAQQGSIELIGPKCDVLVDKFSLQVDKPVVGGMFVEGGTLEMFENASCAQSVYLLLNSKMFKNELKTNNLKPDYLK